MGRVGFLMNAFSDDDLLSASIPLKSASFTLLATDVKGKPILHVINEVSLLRQTHNLPIVRFME